MKANVKIKDYKVAYREGERGKKKFGQNESTQSIASGKASTL